MIKVYKRLADAILYWEAWDHDDKIIIHSGRLGDTGETREVGLSAREKPDEIIAREAAHQIASGYCEVPLEGHFQLILKYATRGWGSSEDLNKRHRIEDLLNECLGWTGNGHCDGGQIGSGAIEVFSFVIDPIVGVSTIVEALRRKDLLEGAVVSTETEAGTIVLWPKDDQREPAN